VAIDHLSVVSVPVSDQERAKSFYTEKLGFELLADSPFGEGQRWIQVGPKGTATSITLVTWFETMPPGSTKGIVLECDDLDGTHQELVGRGVRFDGPVQEAPWGRFATFEDPDGNGWVLQASTLPQQA
jgi:catechol 2,3-dioxygenase-like lactoylglutathione lyase family enzyme